MTAGEFQAVEKQHIASDGEVCGGKPRIAGTRIRVWDIHVWHDLQGMIPEEIVAEFPQVTVADVHAALTYYHDHRELIERQNLHSQELVKQLKGRYTSKLGSPTSKDGRVDSVSS